MNAITPQGDVDWAIMEKVIVGGDLGKLSAQERIGYYRQLCESLKLNPLTRPFQYITLQGKLTLYATKDATEQIRRHNRISIDRVEKEVINDTYVVTVYGRTDDGRVDTEMGAVNIANKRGDDLVNAMLKALTKAKRRLTLSMCGLGILDETELETIRGARVVTPEELGATVDAEGQVIDIPAEPRQIAPPEPERDPPSQKLIDRVLEREGQVRAFDPAFKFATDRNFAEWSVDALTDYGHYLRDNLDRLAEEARRAEAQPQTILEQQAAISEAQAAFWHSYGGAMGGTTWAHVQRELGPIDEPTDDAGWVQLAAQMNEHLNTVTAKG